MARFASLFLLAILIIFTTGCAENLTQEEIQERILEANSNLDSYSLDVTGSMQVGFEFLGQRFDMTYNLDADEKIDRKNKEMYARFDLSSSSGQINQDAVMETYVIDNYLYTMTNGGWSKTRLDEDIWTRQDQFIKTFELYKDGKVEFLGEEEIDGKTYYKAKITPDYNKVAAIYNQPNLKVESYSSTVWINKKTFIIERIITGIKIKAGVNQEDDEKAIKLFGGAGASYNFDVKIKNINERVDITLPAEALNAKEEVMPDNNPLVIS